MKQDVAVLLSPVGVSALRRLRVQKSWWGISPSDPTMFVPCVCFTGRITPETS